MHSKSFKGKATGNLCHFKSGTNFQKHPAKGKWPGTPQSGSMSFVRTPGAFSGSSCFSERHASWGHLKVGMLVERAKKPGHGS